MASIEHDISLVIVEPKKLLAFGLQAILKNQYPTVHVVTMASWDRAVIDRNKGTLRSIIVNPSLVFNDDNFVQRIRRHYPNVAIIALQSMHLPAATLQQFDDCINVYAPPEEALAHLAPYLLGMEEGREQKPTLSAREVEVLRRLVLGKTAKEIGNELFISEHTVTSHRKNIAEKLGIKTIPGMTIYAVTTHLIEFSDLKQLQGKNEGE